MTFSDSVSTRSSATPVVLAAAVAIGILTFLVAVLGMVLGIGVTNSTEAATLLVAGVILRSLFSLAIVWAVIRVAASMRRHLPPERWVLVALVGYLLNPMSWGGNALLTATFLGGADQTLVARLVGFVVDACIWSAVAFLAAQGAMRRPERERLDGLR